MIEINKVSSYEGIVPNKEVHTDEEFANNIFGFLNFTGVNLVSSLNTTIPQINELSNQMVSLYEDTQNLKDESTTAMETIVEKEGKVNPHYEAIDLIHEKIDSIDFIVSNINIISNTNENTTYIKSIIDPNLIEITAVGASIDNVNLIASNTQYLKNARTFIDSFNALNPYLKNLENIEANLTIITSIESSLTELKNLNQNSNELLTITLQIQTIKQEIQIIKEEVIAKAVTLPDGTINDGTVSSLDTWSSSKIVEVSKTNSLKTTMNINLI